MDAVPVTLGQEFNGYAAQVRLGGARIRDTLARVGQIPLGGTATGTGLNTHPEFAERVRARLAEATGLEISAPEDPFEAQGNRDALVELSGALKVLAVSLIKIANDLALMGSGPRAGLAEIRLPELQKGSSIMPGKVNPVIPEVTIQVGDQVIGNDPAITLGGSQGQFELNVRVPLIARNLLDSIKLLAATCRLLDTRVRERDRGRTRRCSTRHAESTLATATALNPHIGYDRGDRDRQGGGGSDRTLREVAPRTGRRRVGARRGARLRHDRPPPRLKAVDRAAVEAGGRAHRGPRPPHARARARARRSRARLPVALKLELTQRTGSFKLRGAFNALLSAPRPPEAGIVAASGGNFGVAAATAAQDLGIPCRDLRPRGLAEAKVERLRRTAADVHLTGALYDDSLRRQP